MSKHKKFLQNFEILLQFSEHLSLNLLNFLNGLVLLPFLELPFIHFCDIKMRIKCCPAYSIEPGQTERICSTDVKADLALYWWQRLIIFSSSRIRVKQQTSASNCDTILLEISITTVM